MYQEKQKYSYPVITDETNGFIDAHENRYTSPDEHYKS